MCRDGGGGCRWFRAFRTFTGAADVQHARAIAVAGGGWFWLRFRRSHEQGVAGERAAARVSRARFAPGADWGDAPRCELRHIEVKRRRRAALPLQRPKNEPRREFERCGPYPDAVHSST